MILQFPIQIPHPMRRHLITRKILLPRQNHHSMINSSMKIMWKILHRRNALRINRNIRNSFRRRNYS
jgi:hypothetical protein